MARPLWGVHPRHPDPQGRLPRSDWEALLHAMPLLWRLTAEERSRLFDLAERFLQVKNLDPVGGLELNEGMARLLALQACLPILNLGLEFYDNWQTIILYPGDFVPEGTVVDDAGVVHPRGPHSGEAWPNGPVILSWEEVFLGGVESGSEPVNVVIHELSHQLDVRGGGFDGMPPLHRPMNPRLWIRDFTQGFRQLRELNRLLRRCILDPYGAESPAEFFAVAVEAFFTAAADLGEQFPAIYRQLALFFRQDPLRTTGPAPGRQPVTGTPCGA
ncbi:MAG: zinc-dependent peptidase [Magnetococcales bacterium]|nr:zinc-dependent peptidase [Magnetococcales bacterium]